MLFYIRLTGTGTISVSVVLSKKIKIKGINWDVFYISEFDLKKLKLKFYITSY